MVDLSRSCKKEQLLESRNKHVHTCIYQPTLMEIGVVMQCIANLFVKQGKKKKMDLKWLVELFLFDSLINRWSFIFISALSYFKEYNILISISLTMRFYGHKSASYLQS